ncbi:MAG: 3',5'-cyclic-nucleotide phosphodiesterase [Gammaproteobacteria bacterium]|nr:3',5'-cyclic-nucleotide phosphodiesterase [Gammaproteobacteria bacterium]
MRLRVLGCSGGIGKKLRTTSLLVDDDVLIDAGSGVGDLTLDEMAGIRHIFLTHTHLDHVAFLPLLVDSIFERIHEPVVVHGLPETIKGIQDHIFNWVIWPDFSKLPTRERPVMRFQVERSGSICTVGGRRFELIPVNHIVPTVGYRVESAAGKSFAFSGDTANNDTFWDALNVHGRLDLLLLEVAFSNEDEALSRVARHYCAKTLAEDIHKLKLDPDIYLTHHKPDAEKSILKEVKSLIKGRAIKALKNGLVFQL